jgi:hypothetical protein
MREKIDKKVSVIFSYDVSRGLAVPRQVTWGQSEYVLDKLGYHHTILEGRVLVHIFSVACVERGIAFRLLFHTDTLHWTLDEVSDGRMS